MFRRLETRGLPEQPGDTLFWDFRAEDDDTVQVPPGSPQPIRWTLALQAWASGRWRRPNQADWLAQQGWPVPTPDTPVVLPADVLVALTDALAPVSVVSWRAMDARDNAIAQLQHGNAKAALEALSTLEAAAPDWTDTQIVKLELLVRHERDPDAAEAVLQALPDGTLDPTVARRVRESIAILRNDWDAYTAEVAAVLAGGEREWWNFEILGLGQWAAGRIPDAIETFERGLAEHPGQPDLALRRVEALAAAGNVPAAREGVAAILREPNPPAKAWALRGWLARNDDPAAAAQDYEQALTIDPLQAVARVGRGLQRLAAHDLAGAFHDLSPMRYCGWQDAWDAWVTYATAAGIDPGVAPDAAGEACDHGCEGPEHHHDHGHSHASHGASEHSQ